MSNAEFEFDRYVNGVLMAEGIRITRQPDLAGAMQAAVRLCHNDRNVVLVLRNTALSSQDDVRDRALEEAAQVADGFTCGGCGMDGKSGRAIREGWQELKEKQIWLRLKK